MALRFLDSFDHYTTLTQKWTTPGVSCSILAAAARTGAQGLRYDGAGPSLTRITLDAQGTWITGFALRINAAQNSCQIWASLDGASHQAVLVLNNDLTLSLYRDNQVTLLATSALALSQGVYYYIEVKHIIADAAGTLEVRVDGAVWATFAGDTQATANPTANVIGIGRSSQNVSTDFDDPYILDGTGAAPNNDYWGNTQIECLVPTGAGAYTEWTTLFGAPTHWQAEDEVPPDEDTSYVESATLDQRDTFAFGNLSVISAVINGIQVLMRGRTTLAGADNLARLYRQGVVDYQGADVALQTGYNYIREILELDPAAGPGAWSVGNVNSAEFGARVR